MKAEFIKAVVERLEEKLGGKNLAEIQSVPKNNGVVQTGLSLKGGKEDIRLTVSLEPYYEQYRNGMSSLDEVVEDICGLLVGNEGEDGFGEGNLSRYPELKGKVVFRLINRGMNRELLEEIPHVPFLDMEIVFMVVFGQNEKGQMSGTVSNEMMWEWGESPQGLLSQAKKNTPLLSPVSLESMEEVMKKIAKSNMGEDYDEDLVSRLLEEGQKETSSSLYVLTNQRGIHGAAAMLYPELLKNFAESHGADLAVLPSSVHEVILVPVKGDLDFEWLRCMVRNINRSEVPPEDWLSDQVYVYRRKEGRVEIAE